MTRENRKASGKLFAEGKTDKFEMHYKEFKNEIDRELGIKPVEKSKGGK